MRQSCRSPPRRPWRSSFGGAARAADSPADARPPPVRADRHADPANRPCGQGQHGDVRRERVNRMQVGIAFTPFETRSAPILRLAEQADRAGLARVDVAEGWTLDAPTLLTEIALRTERIGIG